MVEVRLKTGWQEIISHVAGDLALSDFLLLQQLNQPQQPFGSTFSASTHWYILNASVRVGQIWTLEC